MIKQKQKLMQILLLIGFVCILSGMLVADLTHASANVKEFIKGLGCGLSLMSAFMLWRLKRQAKRQARY